LDKYSDLPVENHSAKVNTVLSEVNRSEILSPISGTIVENHGKYVENGGIYGEKLLDLQKINI